MQTKTMKPVIAAVAMLLLLTLTMMGARSLEGCEKSQRSRADSLEWRNNASSYTPPASPVC